MQLINIVPVKNMVFIKEQPMGMFLTHLVERYEEYREFARNFKGYKILDNSLIELGGSVSLQRVVEAAVAIQADEIILPDVFRDGYATYDAVTKSLQQMKELSQRLSKPVKLMAVCQGKDMNEFVACFEALNKLEEIDVIGIPKVCAKMSTQGRPWFEWLWNSPKCAKQIHLLGLWYSFEELSRYQNLDRIRSMDTCLPSFFAVHDLPWDAVRPDGFTVNLEGDFMTYRRYRECQPLGI